MTTPIRHNIDKYLKSHI